MDLIENKSSNSWTNFFQLFKAPEKNNRLNHSQAISTREAGRLSNIFSDSDEDVLNQTAPMKRQEILIHGGSRRNIFERKLIFDLRRILICLYLLSNSNIELKSRFICSLYETLNTDTEITEIFESIIFVALKAVPHFAFNAVVKQEKA